MKKRTGTSSKILYAFLTFGVIQQSVSVCLAANGMERDDELLTLIHLMETDIATQTDLQDPDKAPGLVTVLSGGDLRARGFQFVRDALAHQAGFDITIDSRGIVTPAVRGIGGIRSGASGKVKLLVNGTMTNIVRAGGVEDGMEIPINLVDRIEIIRGPGSAVHGEFAYAAVVNVITRKGDTELNAYLGGKDNRGFDGLYNYSSESGFTFDLLASARETDPDVTTGPDALYAIGQGAVSLAPGKSNEFQESRFLISSMNYENSELHLLWSDHNYGDFFGLSSSLAPEKDEARRDNQLWIIEGRQLFNINDDTDLRVKAGYQFFRGDFKNITIQPPGYSLFIPPVPAFNFPGLSVTYENGILAETHYEEERYSATANLTYRGLDRQTLLFGVEYAHVEDPESRGAINLDIDNPNPLFAVLPTPEIEEYPGNIASIVEGQVREISSVYIQDEYRPGDNLTITAGARFDSYSDVKSSLNPRLAFVYQLNENHILKAQYGAAFRPPTYAELFSAATTSLGNPDIEPETIDTYELGWIYKTLDKVFRTTVFRSELDRLIVLMPTGFGTQAFANTGGATSQGLELEGEVSLSRQLKLDGNLSWIDTEDEVTGSDLEGTADVMASLGLVYQPDSTFSLSLSYRYVGKRHRAPQDPREKLDDYQTLDFTINAFNIVSEGVTLRASVYNLFDEDVAFPSPANSYPGDFPRPGRTWLLELAKTFR